MPRLCKDARGSVLVEAAITLPMMILLLLGAVSYGAWFMAAHSLQQAANEGARAALAGLDADERDGLVAEVVAEGVLGAGTVNAANVEVATALVGNLYTVTVSYDPPAGVLFASGLIPMPEGPIARTASVRLSSL